MSTLHPGKVSQAIADLRASALREMDKTPDGVDAVRDLAFDLERPPIEAQPSISDEDNGVSRYAGPNVPHIGNGDGGPR